MIKKSKKQRDLIWNTLGTTLNAFNSLFFLVVVTRINGVDNAGIFTFAYSTGMLLFIIGVYCGRVFQVTDRDKENDDISYLNVHIITTIIMVILGISFSIIRGYELTKVIAIISLVVVKALEAISDTFHAMIQKNNELYKVGISLTIRSVISLMTFVIVDLVFKDMLLAIYTHIIINLLVLVFYDIKNANLSLLKNYYFDKKKVIKIFKEGFFVFTFTFLNLFLLNTAKYAIDFNSTNKVQTIFGIIVMPATVVSLVAQFIIHPFILEIKEDIKENKYKELARLIGKLSSVVVAFTMLCLICAWFLGIPVLNMIYGVKLDNYKVGLMFILIGAMFYAITTILSNVLISFRKTISQAVIYFVIVIVCTIISFILVKNFDIDGAVYSYLIAMVLIFVSFLTLTNIVIKNESRGLKS